jgi:hypothetical protein
MRIWLQRLLLLFLFVFLFFVLSVPDSLLQLQTSALLVLPLELPLLGLALFLAGTLGRCLRWLAAALLAARVVLILADTVSYQVFARPFNPVFDAYLLANAMNLLNGVLGQFVALAVAALATALIMAIIAGAFWLLGTIRQPLIRHPAAIAALLLAAISWVGLRALESPRATLRFYEHLSLHAHNVNRSFADMHEFRELLAQQLVMDVAQPEFLQKLRGKDVLVVFIESYGRTLLDKPEFAGHFRPFLTAGQKKLEASGIGVRSAYLTSPTVGGLSWFAHATAMSGLWVDSQVRYDSLVLSRHQSLNRLFRDAGWRTLAVMPAITMAWPEAEYFGYDHIYHAHNSGYAGKPFNWVTMPDQYTLAAFHRSEIEPAAPKPIMAEIALISSHAPWTPVPTLIDWNSVGDGQIFNSQAEGGDKPEEVWRDPVRIRLQYRLSVEYSLLTLIDYLIKHADDDLVVIALGDHQPAPLVTGATDNRDVPVHFFARDPEILAAVADWQWREGLLPADAPMWKMSEIRNRLLEAMSAPPSL